MQKKRSGGLSRDLRGLSGGAIALIIILIIFAIGIFLYFLLGTKSLSCDIQSSFSKIESSQGVISSLSLTGYRGTINQVSWTTENPEVAVVNPVSGIHASVEAKGIGSTRIIATDNAVGSNCNVYIPVEVN